MKRTARHRPEANSTVAANRLAAGAGCQGGQDNDLDGRREQANGTVGEDGVGPGGMKGIELRGVGAVEGEGAAAGDAAVRGRAAHGERHMVSQEIERPFSVVSKLAVSYLVAPLLVTTGEQR